MRTLIAALLLALAPALAACAPAPAQPQGEPALWRIADADSEIWLFGTAHMLPPELNWRGPRFEAAFAAADELVTETDASPEGGAQAYALSEAHGRLEPGQALTALLSAEDQAQFARVASALRLDPATLETMRPWLAALRLSYADAITRGLSPAAGVENVLAADARARGMRMSFLETPEQQVRFLADLPEAAQIRFLRDTMQAIEAGETGIDQLDDLWARGDVEALAALFDAQWQAGSPALYETIILARNRAWADAIQARLAGEGRIFIAVGAAHLIGEGNVIDLLRERGIEVEGP
ncbi:MAG: TraB/GumN family protein [Terricaulis sp.]|nr:TraB/GumN family protein [Terricaulis sp.]